MNDIKSEVESLELVVFITLGYFVVFAISIAATGLHYGLSLNNRVDRQRDFLCATYAGADATLRDCPAPIEQRIKELERELGRLREERR